MGRLDFRPFQWVTKWIPEVAVRLGIETTAPDKRQKQVEHAFRLWL